MLEMTLMLAGLMVLAAGILFLLFIFDCCRSGRDHEEKFDGRITQQLDIVDDDDDL